MDYYDAEVASANESQPIADRSFLSVNIRNTDDATLNPIAVPSASPAYGDLFQTSLVTAINQYNSVVSSSANSAFYNRYIFSQNAEILNTLLVGSVYRKTTFTFNMWNGYGKHKTISAVSATAGQGLNVTSPVAGTILNPWQEIPLVVEVDERGPARIDAEIVLIVGGVPVSIDIKGIRVASTYLLDMNWAGGTTTVRRFLTSVYQSGTAAETRKAQRFVPIRDINTTIPYYNKETAIQARASASLSARQEYAIPLYMDGTRATKPNDLSKIYCATAYRRFESGGLAVILRKNTQDTAMEYFDIVTIDVVESDGITTKSPVLNSYAIGDIVYPLTICAPCFSDIEHEVFHDGAGEYRTTSTELYGSGLGNENAEYSPTLVRGIPIYPFRVNYAEDVGSSIKAFGEAGESGRGQAYYVASDPDISYSGTSVFSSREEWWEAVGFFNYIKGRLRKFWHLEPIDLYVIAAVPTTTRIDIDTRVNQLDMDFLKYLHMTDADGNAQIVEVTNIEGIEGGMTLTTEIRTIGVPVKLRTAKLVRLDSDEIEETWMTSSVVTLSFVLRDLSQAEI